ncbi:uncharacterized protein [Onthophagus taurus]|uniref:uncharacterized protein n=1 Tax=Onthophagus taurus TaxID=166361 RepID=UPI0039BEC08A
MSRLRQLGQCQFSPKKNISELEVNKMYVIKSAKRITSCAWPSVVVDLEDGFSVFLPKRIAEVITDGEITELGGMSLIFKGVKDVGKGNPAHLIDFVKNHTSSSSSSSPRPPPKQQPSNLCRICGVDFISTTHLRTHLRLEHATPVEGEDNIDRLESCFKGRVCTYRVAGVLPDDDIPSFLTRSEGAVKRMIEVSLDRCGPSIKVQIEFFANYVKAAYDENGDEDVLMSEKNFNCKFQVVSVGTDLHEVYVGMCREILAQSEEFQERDSGWAFFSVSHLLLNINKFEPIPGSSYIRLPQVIAEKHACVNIKNYEDDACLSWCLTAALHPANHSRDRTTSYPHYSQVLNLQGITFPITLKDIINVEKLNNLSINVYELISSSSGKYTVEGPIYFTRQRRDIHINLLYLYENGKGHFVLIKNLSRLISSQVTHREHSIHLCDGCLTRFSSADKLLAHQPYDCNHVMTVLPTTDLKSKSNFFGLKTPQNILEFNNYKYTQMAPFVIYADFESLLKPIDYCKQSSAKSFTEKIEEHQPYSFAYYIVSNIDSRLNKFETYTGPDAPKIFISKLIDDVKLLYNKYFKTVKPMIPLTADEQWHFESAENCIICQNHFTSNQVKVRDHCHISGKYRGPAHSNCNLNLKLQNFIPIFFHNFSGYDCHLFIKEMGDVDKDGLDVLPNNKERYISFSKRFLVDKISSSLDSLAGNLNEFDFISMRKSYPHNDHFKLLTKKGIFPYTFMSSFDRLNATFLPPKETFFNNLNLEGISDEQYVHAQTVWKKFNCQTFKDYSDLYLKTDVLLLADVFEKFRRVCFKTYGLDPAHYYTAPGLSWDAMLKVTQIKLELLTDIDQVHFIKKGIRGGISQCSLRHGKANNKYMENYDANAPSKFLMYWDANNLYGWAMSQFMPVSNFKWLTENEIQNLDFNNIPDDSDFGYILDVDIAYPEHLHNLHNDLPFLAENLIPPNCKCESDKRLIPNLFDKTNYVIHYRNLKQAVAHGLTIRKVNRVLSFKQSPWLKSYIDKNTELRQSAKNDFEKDFFKLMNNAVFGKTMENVDKRADVRLVTSWDDIRSGKTAGRPRLGARSLIAKLNFKSVKVFTETFSAIQMERLHVVYDKPLYVGFTVLELSKLLMYDFYYDFLKSKYGEDVQLCYMDTDSFTVLIKSDDVYNDVKLNLDKFDTSNYSPDNRFDIPLQNKAVLGKMKDENCGNVMVEFNGLRSKVYANRVADGRVTKKSKGIKKAVVKQKLSFQNYFDCLHSNSVLCRKQLLFRSFNHTVFTVLQNKLALSPHDSKRCIDADGIKTLAWGHFTTISNNV